jgi:hypothetical protein
MADTMNDPPDDVALLAQTLAKHEVVFLAFRDELVELRALIDQNLIRIKHLERRGQEAKRER